MLAFFVNIFLYPNIYYRAILIKITAVRQSLSGDYLILNWGGFGIYKKYLKTY